MNQKTKYYIYSGILAFGAFVTMASGMQQLISVNMDDFHTCLLRRDCLLYRGLIVLILVSFANYFIFQARMIDTKRFEQEKNSSILGYGWIAVMFLGYAVFEIASMRGIFLRNLSMSKPMACLFDMDCLFPEFMSVIIMLYMSGFFINLTLKTIRLKIPDAVGQDAKQKIIPLKEPEETKTDTTMVLFLRILTAAMVLLYCILAAFEVVLKPIPENKNVVDVIIFLLILILPIAIIGLIGVLVITAYFTQKRIENDYPELFEIMNGFDIGKRIKYRSELKSLRSKTHKVMGYYNRISARIGLAIIVLIISLIVAALTIK